MSYYAGDFYASGDPGFFSSIGRFFGRKVLPIAAGMVPGGGAIMATARGVAGGLARRGAGAIVKHPGIAAVGAIATAGGAAMTIAHRGSPTAAGMAMGAGVGFPGVGAMGPRGFHMSKPHAGVAPHLVRNRRMRVTNPRALRRAIRRANGFARLARRVLHFTSPRPPKGRAIFRAKRKRRL